MPSIAKVRDFEVRSSSCIVLSGICTGACEVLKGAVIKNMPSDMDKMGSLTRLLNMAYFLRLKKTQFWENNMVYSEKNHRKGQKRQM